MDPNIMVQSAGDDVLISISGDCTIVQAAALAEVMRDALAIGSNVYGLDLHQVSEMDCAGLQLLLASRRSCELAGRPWQLLSINDTVNGFLSALRQDELVTTAALIEGEHHV